MKMFSTSASPTSKNSAVPKPKAYTDVRKLLEDKDIDAVSIATPNHWHSLIGIWTLQAGKDVYVEKPCSHNTFEGRQLVAAVKKYNRICQHGSQWRSNPGLIEAMKHLKEDGTIGDVYMARGLCFKWRPTIGKAPQEPVPAGVHYDLWTGPAPLKPFTKNRFHYNWHWIWDTGNGEIGNQAIHEIDIARAGLGVGFPVQVSAIGGHFMFDDDQQTPNTLNAAYIFETARRQTQNDGDRSPRLDHQSRSRNRHRRVRLEFRSARRPHRRAKTRAEKKSAAAAQQTASLGPKDAKTNTVGNIFYGSNGYLAIDGYDAYRTWLTDDVEPGPHGKASGDHYANFIDCVRSRDAEQNQFADPRSAHLHDARAPRQRFIPPRPHAEVRPRDGKSRRRRRSQHHAPRHLPRPLRRGRKNLTGVYSKSFDHVRAQHPLGAPSPHDFNLSLLSLFLRFSFSALLCVLCASALSFSSLRPTSPPRST